MFLLHQVIVVYLAKAAIALTSSNSGCSLSPFDFPLCVTFVFFLHFLPQPSGNFGDVYKATLETPNGRGVEVAVKTVSRRSSEKERNDFIKEMVAMTTMLHPNIVYLHGLVLEGTRCYDYYVSSFTFSISSRKFDCIGIFT